MGVEQGLPKTSADLLDEEPRRSSRALSFLVNKMRNLKPMHPMGIYPRGGYLNSTEDDVGKEIRVLMSLFENYLKEAGLPIVHDESTEAFWREMKYYFDHFVRNDRPLGIVDMLVGAEDFLSGRREKYRILVSKKIKSSPTEKETGIPFTHILSRVNHRVSDVLKGLFA